MNDSITAPAPLPADNPVERTALFQPILTVEVHADGSVTADFDWSESLLGLLVDGEIEPADDEHDPANQIAAVLDQWLDGSVIANGETLTIRSAR